MKTYKKYEGLPSVRLTKADLERLVRLSTEHVTSLDQGDTRISASFGDVAIEAPTLDAFLAHDDLPPVLDELRIWGATEQRSITVQFGAFFSSIAIEGDDEVWVRGSFERLRDFLQARRRFEPPRLFASTLVGSIGGGIVLAAIVLLFIQGALISGVLASIAGMYLLLRYVRWTLLPPERSTQIWLADQPARWRGLLTYDNLMAAISVLALIVAIIQIFT